MLNPSAEIIQLLAIFSTGMTAPTFGNALTLLYGSILTPGRRTVTTALRVMGLEQEQNFTKYHQVLNRAKWSPMLMSHLLLSLLIKLFVSEGETIVLLVDETLERRQGHQVKYRSYFRDA
ncbi:MAG: transposase, partial [Armatimonadota bacterium]|nr:transposase [Armatimonadota bacterium]